VRELSVPATPTTRARNRSTRIAGPVSPGPSPAASQATGSSWRWARRPPRSAPQFNHGGAGSSARPHSSAKRMSASAPDR